jgi:hypothetical protein
VFVTVNDAFASPESSSVTLSPAAVTVKLGALFAREISLLSGRSGRRRR